MKTIFNTSKAQKKNPLAIVNDWILSRANIGVALAIGSAFIWGSNAVIGRFLAQDGVSTNVIAFLRVLIGGLVLAGISLIGSKSVKIEKINKRRLFWTIAATFFYGGNMLIFHAGLKYATASIIMILENTAPIFVAMGAFFLFKERLTYRTFAAVIISCIGVFFIFAHSNKQLFDKIDIGMIFGLVAGFTWGGYTLACRGQSISEKKSDKLSDVIYPLLGSSILLLPFVLKHQIWPCDISQWSWVVILGVVHTALACWLWRKSLNYISASAASLIFLSTVVFTMINSAVFLGETFDIFMITGSILIMAGLLLVEK